MIPKIIHYCWFGNKNIPKLERHCMESWKKFLPDYEIKRWDETTFDVNSSSFTKAAYDAKKYAFVADYVRLFALTNYGGLYLDTDIEIIKSLSDLLEKHDAIGGFETVGVLQTGLLATIPHHPIFEEFFSYYKEHSFVWGGKNATKPNSAILATIMSRHGLLLDNIEQNIANVAIYPQDYFCPIDQGSRKIVLTERTYCIHYLSGSWFPKHVRLKNKIKKILSDKLGANFTNMLRHIFVK